MGLLAWGTGSIAVMGIESAQAQDVRGLGYEALGTLTSKAGETETQFLDSIRAPIRAFIDRTGFEACAEIGQAPDGKSWGLILGSSHSHIGCAVVVGRVPSGMKPTGVTIHGHPALKRFSPNPNDKILLGAMGMDDYDILPLTRAAIDHFSPDDFAGGPGYLATPAGLLYQNGHPGSETVVKVSTAAL
ncbi:hypothetical protein B0E46_07300 [Rhodanobacter sp. B04]|nr:hypothetical protein B0E46_07300 [Rhodanobacter sp. B04]